MTQDTSTKRAEYVANRLDSAALNWSFSNQSDEAKETAALIRALAAERDALRAALSEMVNTFCDAGCHVCGGDCASANPPVGGCPVSVIHRARAALKGKDHGQV